MLRSSEKSTFAYGVEFLENVAPRGLGWEVYDTSWNTVDQGSQTLVWVPLGVCGRNYVMANLTFIIIMIGI